MRGSLRSYSHQIHFKHSLTSLQEEMDAKRAKTKAARERRQERVEAKRLQLSADDPEKKS